ncbi:MAG: hypothetical protein COB07_00485 [Sulfurovum sp.]|nr:MAG: hypothetical protein COB07_00485 [Sulfurovum sp.]
MKNSIVMSLAGVAVLALVGCTDGGAYPSSNGNAPSVTPYVKDLVGAKGRDGEISLEERGFVYVKTEKSDTDSYTYWKHSRSGQCITVRTSEGRYASIVNSPAFDCQQR